MGIGKEEVEMKRSDELADAFGENADAVGNLGNKTALGSKGTNSVAHQFSSANSSHVYGDEFDTSGTMLNIQKIEPIDEATTLHICLLFLDIALASHDPWKFVNFIRKHQDDAKNTNKPPTNGLNKTN
ncbi:hypothetical protein HYC85_016280 [Camellia sinensis]|uniref:Uncharacterized protein n=1 Tax=Camellia sinensis TaxID=4442 RepID=A0A7J7GZ62_CAMSI|nr:hypothetical protein HYC85_016280 [Camellia sinensis]